MRYVSLVLTVAVAVAFVGCCSGQTRVAAAPVVKSKVYTPVCSGGKYDKYTRPEGDEEYVPPTCNSWEVLVQQLKEVKCPLRGMGIPGLECPAPAASFVPEPAAAASSCK